MKKSLRILIIMVMLLLMTACAEHPVDTHLSSAPSGSSSSVPTPTVSVPKPTVSVPTDPCSNGHTFPDDATICSVCGADYFSVTLKFELNDTKDGYIVSNIGTCSRPDIVVPALYNGLPVTEIGLGAFVTCDWITRVALPDSVTKIGDGAFEACESLTEIRLSEYLIYIGHNAFNCCFSLKEMIIPERVTYLGDFAFSFCTGLQRISLHDGITGMGECTFQGCESLKSIYVPKSITAIPVELADSCKSLETVEFGGEITSIGFGAFRSCESLITIDLGDKIERIGELAFAGSALEELVLPDSVKWIDAKAFSGCKSLRKISITSGLEKLGNQITEGCDKLEYTIYQGMQYLGNADNPHMILVGRSDPDQKHLVVHEDTRFIPDNETFNGLDIQTIYIGKSVECIYGWTEKDNQQGKPFRNMDALEKIEVSPDNKTYHASGNCLIEMATKTLVQGCKNSVIPDDGSVEIIDGFSFVDIDGLTSFVIPDSVKAIGTHAFRDCVNLKWLVIGAGVEKIDNEILWEVHDVTIYYMGTEEDWGKIQIIGINVHGFFGSNSYLKKAPRYYYSETAPTEEGNFWHYVDGKPTPWKSEE